MKTIYKYINTAFALVAVLATVTVTQAQAILGGSRNPNPADYVPDQYEATSNGMRDPNRIKFSDSTWTFKVYATTMVDSYGNSIQSVYENILGDIGSSYYGGVNAGMLTTISGVKYVYAFDLNGSGGKRSGWVPLSKFSHYDEVENIQNLIKANMGIPDDSGHAFYIKTVSSTVIPSNMVNLYVYPNQSGAGNKALYYFYRVDTGIINVLVNLPHTGGYRVGASCDAAAPGRTFHQDKSVSSVDIPTYAANSSTPTAYPIKFVWGFIVTNSGVKNWGWINYANLY